MKSKQFNDSAGTPCGLCRRNELPKCYLSVPKTPCALGAGKFTANLYISGEYLRKNPTLGEEDTAFKVRQIIPLVERFFECTKKTEIKILDVGGKATLKGARRVGGQYF